VELIATGFLEDKIKHRFKMLLNSLYTSLLVASKSKSVFKSFVSQTVNCAQQGGHFPVHSHFLYSLLGHSQRLEYTTRWSFHL